MVRKKILKVLSILLLSVGSLSYAMHQAPPILLYNETSKPVSFFVSAGKHGSPLPTVIQAKSVVDFSISPALSSFVHEKALAKIFNGALESLEDIRHAPRLGSFEIDLNPKYEYVIEADGPDVIVVQQQDSGTQEQLKNFLRQPFFANPFGPSFEQSVENILSGGNRRKVEPVQRGQAEMKELEGKHNGFPAAPGGPRMQNQATINVANQSSTDDMLVRAYIPLPNGAEKLVTGGAAIQIGGLNYITDESHRKLNISEFSLVPSGQALPLTIAFQPNQEVRFRIYRRSPVKIGLTLEKKLALSKLEYDKLSAGKGAVTITGIK